MRVAVPIFGDQVSPLLGCNSQLLIASIEDGRIQAEELQDCSGLAPGELPEFLGSLNVDTVVCGGIPHRLQDEIERKGIRVIWGIIGSAAEALAAFGRGALRSDQFVCPRTGRGSRGGRHRHRGRAGPGAPPPVHPKLAPEPPSGGATKTNQNVASGYPSRRNDGPAGDGSAGTGQHRKQGEA